MTLVDTSVWIHHLRHGSRELRALLDNGEVLSHPFVIGELACGSMSNRDQILDLLAALPMAAPAEHHEVMLLLHEHRLHGRGLGWVDLHLLASASLSKARLWTADRALRKAAEEHTP